MFGQNKWRQWTKADPAPKDVYVSYLARLYFGPYADRRMTKESVHLSHSVNRACTTSRRNVTGKELQFTTEE